MPIVPYVQKLLLALLFITAWVTSQISAVISCEIFRRLTSQMARGMVFVLALSYINVFRQVLNSHYWGWLELSVQFHEKKLIETFAYQGCQWVYFKKTNLETHFKVFGWDGNYATCGSCHLAHAAQSAHTPRLLQRYDRWVSCTN